MVVEPMEDTESSRGCWAGIADGIKINQCHATRPHELCFFAAERPTVEKLLELAIRLIRFEEFDIFSQFVMLKCYRSLLSSHWRPHSN
jgi:hypothetical protein